MTLRTLILVVRWSMTLCSSPYVTPGISLESLRFGSSVFWSILSGVKSIFGPTHTSFEVEAIPDYPSLSPDSASPLLFNGLLSQRAGSIRLFIIDLKAIGGDSIQSFPVVFDTGSSAAWVISQSLANIISADRKGYQVSEKVRPLDFERDIRYLSVKTTCTGWYKETLSFDGMMTWASPLCIASESGVTLRAVSGVVGADLNSALVKSYGIFWLIPHGYNPTMGLVLGDRVDPDSVCKPKTLVYSGIPLDGGVWSIKVRASAGNNEMHEYQARMDTGVHRVYLPEDLWNHFVAVVVLGGLKLDRIGPSTDYFARNCGEALSHLPTFNFSFGGLHFALDPTMYVKVSGAESGSPTCHFQVSDSPSASEILVGAPVLTRVVTQWDSRSRRMGICLPK